MKTAALLAMMMFVVSVSNALGQGKVLANDPLTGLPLTPASDSGMHLGNEPMSLPSSQVCKSKMQGEFYSLFKTKVDATIDWYASRLSGFKKVRGYASQRAQIAFYKPDGTTLVIITGNKGAEGENVDAYSVAYETFQPGLPEKTILGVAQGRIICP
jgi:hypothetical protein